jgi:TRAP-type C4-dicarboxylate transport system permease small subunit
MFVNSIKQQGNPMNHNEWSRSPHHERLRRLCDLSATLGGLVLIAMALMTVISVIGRAFFSSPILGDVELVQLGTAVVVACFLPYTQFQRANIIVDFFTSGAQPNTQRWMDALGTVLYTVTAMLVLWRVTVGSIDMRQGGESSMLMGLPQWWPYALMLPGLALCAVIGGVQSCTLLARPEGDAS